MLDILINMNIKNKFLELTSRTYPHGTETDMFKYLPNYLETDKFGNLFTQIGDSDVMFASHLDTATSANVKIQHIINKNIIKTNGKSILGADDKAGVVIMLYMIEKQVPGLYYFFIGEEVGCIGSGDLADEYRINKNESIKKVISFDRRGTNSVITHQGSKRCASDKFGNALAEKLNDVESTFNYTIDPTGVATDSKEFTDIYPECTNISVGYYDEHTFYERQNIKHLEKLAEACVKIDWEDLPIERDPSVVEYKKSTNNWNYKYKEDKKVVNVSEFDHEKIYFFDKDFYNLSTIKIDSITKKVIEADFGKKRLDYEKGIIEDLLISLDLVFINTEWNGSELIIDYNGKGHKSKASRNDLTEYLSELDYKKFIIGEPYTEYTEIS